MRPSLFPVSLHGRAAPSPKGLLRKTEIIVEPAIIGLPRAASRGARIAERCRAIPSALAAEEVPSWSAIVGLRAQVARRSGCGASRTRSRSPSRKKRCRPGPDGRTRRAHEFNSLRPCAAHIGWRGSAVQRLSRDNAATFKRAMERRCDEIETYEAAHQLKTVIAGLDPAIHRSAGVPLLHGRHGHSAQWIPVPLRRTTSC